MRRGSAVVVEHGPLMLLLMLLMQRGINVSQHASEGD
jgi:hypothetical protein